MLYITRAQWGALPAQLTNFSNPQRIYAHHTTGVSLGADRSDDWVRNIDRQHHAQGWAGIGYSFLYDAHGQVFEGRGWNKVGAHTFGWNSRSHAFAYLGNGDLPLSSAAVEALRWLVLEHDKRYGVKGIFGHRDARDAAGNNRTHCPGNWIYYYMGAIRNAPSTIPDSGPIVLPSPPTSSSDWFERLVVSLPVIDFRPAEHGQLIVVGGWVDNIQALLNVSVGPVTMDNVGGKQTLAKVKEFQRRVAIADDGVVGEQTWTKLITY